MTKLLFLGCLSSTKYKETCENAQKIINLLDNEYKIIDDAPCCGSLLYHTSSEEEIKYHVQFVYNWLKSNNITNILTICAGCYNYFVTEYPKYIPEYNIKIQHLVQFINEPENLKKLDLKYLGKKLVIAYHDPCHLKNAKIQVIEEPRMLLNSIKGNLVYKDLEQNGKSSICCGAGGGVYSSFKENAEVNTRAIFEQARKSRAKLLLTPCPFCYTALKKVQEEDEKIKINLMKIEDFLNNLFEGVEDIK